MTVMDANWLIYSTLINGLIDGAAINLDVSTQFTAYDQLADVPVNSDLIALSYQH